MKKIRYIICANPRTGNHLLSNLLRNTGLCRTVIELFNSNEHAYIGKTDWGKKDFKNFFSDIFESIESPNGISGFKLMWEPLENFILEINTVKKYRGVSVWDLPSFLPSDVKYIWLKRRDKVKQGVSMLKAEQTGIKINRVGEQKVPCGDLFFDLRQIDMYVGEFKRREIAWGKFFKKNKISPLVLEYEDWTKDFRGAITSVLEHLEIPVPEDLVVKTNLVKQSDALSEEWINRYYKEMTFKNKICLYPIRFARNIILLPLYRASYRFKKRFPTYERFINIIKR